ncbi:MAG: TIGR00159 family protein [Proteobacteria bacterium]|nr:TIGR00159 family protein [Pseudomonadota bacterium]
MLFADNLQQVNWRVVLDIFLVAVICYQIMNMLRGTRAVQVIIGLVVIFIAYAMSGYLELNTLNWIISKFYSSIIVVVIVLFQDDIRRLLTRVGRGPFVPGMDDNYGVRAIEEVINAARTLSHERAGAIVVFERGIGLDRLYDHSVKLDALVNEQLLLSIFQSFSPLHDGAVIIQKGRLTCASAQLPLSKNPSFNKKMGTRHSAAIGIAEETDAVVLVVSEETGNISVAWDGQLQRQPNADVTRRLLITLLVPQNREAAAGIMTPVNFFRRLADKAGVLFGTGANNVRVRLRTENAANSAAGGWSDAKTSPDANGQGTTGALKATVGTVATLGDNQQRWSMSLRLPRHQPAKQAVKTDSLPEPATLFPDNSEENESLGSSEDDVIKSDHRFVPPMPPEPPPRDVTVGGISLNPPIEHSEPPSKIETAESESGRHPEKEKNK